MMEAAGSCGTFSAIYQIARYHIAENSNVNDTGLLDDLMPVFV
jgi:hypothetical protein